LTLNILDLCSGIGGFSLALKWLVGGFKTVGYIEIDRYCREVLRQRIRDGFLDDAPIFHDLRTFSGEQYRGKVDIITAGFPCQPFSIAGKRKGEADERNLWPDVGRVIREVRPPHVFLENVPELLKGYWWTVLAGLAKEGYRLEWSLVRPDGAHYSGWRLFLAAHLSASGFRRMRWKPINAPWSSKEFTRLVRREVQLSVPAGKRGRVSDGIPNRIHRLKALGNAVVPAVVAKAWEVLR
jgi:DNA (cytosine-5)-methyltransferase 1